jgi:hypothetical protein
LQIRIENDQISRKTNFQTIWKKNRNFFTKTEKSDFWRKADIKVREMQNVHACSEFQNLCFYVVENQKIGRKPYFIKIFKNFFFCPGVILP